MTKKKIYSPNKGNNFFKNRNLGVANEDRNSLQWQFKDNDF